MKKQLFLFLLSFLFVKFTVYGYTGEIIKSFDTPGSFVTGLTWDGKNIWLADRKTDQIYCINPSNGKVERSISAPAYWPTGLAWDGQYLWCADIRGGIPLAENNVGKIYCIDPKDGKIIKTIPAPSNSPIGLAWDGQYLWCADNASDEIIQFSPFDGTTIRSFKSPATDPNGLAWDGKYLWVFDRIKNEIYMVDPESGCVIIITAAPGPYTNALCFDGKSLWAADYQTDKLYELKVNDGVPFLKSNERKSKVTYTHQITNFGPGSVKTMDVHFAIPVNRDNQVIKEAIKYIPDFTDIITDKWGQKTAHFWFKDIKAGETREIQMISVISTFDVRYFVYPDKVGSLNDIPDSIKSKYLENNDKYQFDHPIIQAALKEAIGDEKNPYWIARKIFNYLLQKMYYEMTGGWNTAPTVLKRGNGSCSEYSFVYISMCRAAKLPARYVGSVVVRGDDASMDDVFHRWVEVYLPNYGWIPVDPSGGDDLLPHDQADSFGALSNRFYITTQSGGGSETLGWTYNSFESWTTDPKTNVVFENFAEWEPVK
jgi:transglutaminase-like putative cysteine protease/outer membrane protein assembly factor BamB